VSRNFLDSYLELRVVLNDAVIEHLRKDRQFESGISGGFGGAIHIRGCSSRMHFPSTRWGRVAGFAQGLVKKCITPNFRGEFYAARCRIILFISQKLLL